MYTRNGSAKCQQKLRALKQQLAKGGGRRREEGETHNTYKKFEI